VLRALIDRRATSASSSTCASPWSGLGGVTAPCPRGWTRACRGSRPGRGSPAPPATYSGAGEGEVRLQLRAQTHGRLGHGAQREVRAAVEHTQVALPQALLDDLVADVYLDPDTDGHIVSLAGEHAQRTAGVDELSYQRLSAPVCPCQRSSCRDCKVLGAWPGLVRAPHPRASPPRGAGGACRSSCGTPLSSVNVKPRGT